MTKVGDEDAVYVFPICEGAGECFAEDDPTGILWRAHEEEAHRCGAEFYNYGWSNCGDEIASKTSKGILASKINPATMKVTHNWSDGSMSSEDIRWLVEYLRPHVSAEFLRLTLLSQTICEALRSVRDKGTPISEIFYAEAKGAALRVTVEGIEFHITIRPNDAGAPVCGAGGD